MIKKIKSFETSFIQLLVQKGKFLAVVLSGVVFFYACDSQADDIPQNTTESNKPKKTRVLFDTDTNNEIDDQHALAYLLFNGQSFRIEGVTVNSTKKPDVDLDYAEAERIIKLAKSHEQIPLRKGANGTFSEIKNKLHNSDFDGASAVNFIIKKAMAEDDQKLTLLAVGKLTNIALAVKKKPSITSKVRLVWLGSNYPEPGEHNQDADTTAMNYLLNSDIPFEMVTVRYGKPSGTSAVKVTKDQIVQRMPGKGPQISPTIEGRHGGKFNNFGDYSVNLFKNYQMDGNPPSRPLFDMAAVAIVKNSAWAEPREIPAPILIDNKWRERPNNDRQITIWENFHIYTIMSDFFKSMENPVLAGATE